MQLYSPEKTKYSRGEGNTEREKFGTFGEPRMYELRFSHKSEEECMDANAILDVMEQVIDDSHTGVLVTVDQEGNPSSRWMTPTVIRGRTGFLYTVTVPAFRKAGHIERNALVEWMLQTRSLSKIVNVRGRAQIIDNPALKSDVLESIGGHMAVFWKINSDSADFVVIETQIEHLDYFEPTKGRRFSASLSAGKGR